MNKRKLIIGILETVLFNVVVYYLFYKFQHNQDVYLSLNPHPLFLLCLAMGMRYGNFLGIISATISSIFYMKVSWDIHQSVAVIFGYFENYKYFLLFFWSAVILGTFKDRYEANVRRLTDDSQLLKDDYKKLSKSYKISQKIQEELKKQIINSEESILNLYEIASKLEVLDCEEIYTETIGILSKYLKASTVSIYTYNGVSGYLRLKIRVGNINVGNRSMNVADSVGFKKVISDKQVVRWSDIKEEGFPLMSAPLIKDGKVLGIVNVQDMAFDNLSEYAFQLFKLIVEWVNKALERAIYVGELKGTDYIEGTKILHYDAFMKRLKAEERRKEEFGLEFGLLQYRIKNLDLNTIDERMGKFLRSVDVVGYDAVQKRLYLLLPATPKDKLYIVEERISNQLGESLWNM